jgi:transposase
LLTDEPLYIGIDVGKQRHDRFEACPALTFENSREGFRALFDRICAYAPTEHCSVLMERTGHYHRPLEQYLQEVDLPVYLMQVQERPSALLKSDKRDALRLANHLFNQLDRGVQLSDKAHLVRRVVPPSPAVTQLKGLVRHRYELVRETTRRKNKLTAIADQLFPEFTRIFKDPNRTVALSLRERFPTPHAVVTASLGGLRELRQGRHPSDAELVELQRLATDSIGVKDVVRQRGLVLEQEQLIHELSLLPRHVDQLDDAIIAVVNDVREGRILRSIPGVGPIMAAAILAAIGSIHYFPSAAALKAYLGWAPVVRQSGATLARASLTRGGTRLTKQIIYQAASLAIRQPDSEWAQLYDCLVKAKCPYDERRRERIGKRRVMGRVAGQMIELMYALLKRDAELLAALPRHQEPPPPMVYEQAIHHRHRTGGYISLKSQRTMTTTLTLLTPLQESHE